MSVLNDIPTVSLLKYDFRNVRISRLQKEKLFKNAVFGTATILEAQGHLANGSTHLSAVLMLTRGLERWKFDTEEEFIAEYIGQPGFESAEYYKSFSDGEIRVAVNGPHTAIEVTASTRARIEGCFNVFERDLPSVLRPPTEEPKSLKVFIGHGHSGVWRELKDHLQDHHGYAVSTYEVGSRAGHTIRDILESLLSVSNIAFLVMTADDITADGHERARQNVVHELGLFQGRLGFARGIVVNERGIELFSNIDGVQRIEFGSRNIREAFGDVLAVIRREENLGAQ